MLYSLLDISLVQILSGIQFGFGVVFLLGGVIAVHELGHFLCAKYVGARVDVFSIGFGPKLLSKVWRGTEYCLALVPLGGYVKIYGQDKEELADDPNPQPENALCNKGLWQRILVYVGGPGFNFILAVLIFSGLAVVGIKKNPAIAVRIVAESPAYKAGLRSGDKIEKVAGKAVVTFEDLYNAINESPGQTISMTVKREGSQKVLQVPIDKTEAYTPYGEKITGGILLGLEFSARAPLVATTNDANKLGLKHGDLISRINDANIKSWEDVENYFANNLVELPKSFSIGIVRNNNEEAINSPDLSYLHKVVDENWDVLRLMDALDMHSTELFVKAVQPNSPADKAGLKVNDRIHSVNGVRIHSFMGLQSNIQDIGKEATESKQKLDGIVQLKIERDGKIVKLNSGLRESEGVTPLGEKVMNYTIGIESQMQALPASVLYADDMVVERTNNPFLAMWSGVQETGKFTAHTVIGLKKIVFGEVSMKAVGGPIMIAQIGGQTLVKRGIRQFLMVMAIISITLGIVNLLPIPILDGGHVMFALIESVRGKPISTEAMQWSLKIGLVFLMTLMIFAVFNDISRFL